jgi:hypothetical protein
VALEPRQRPGRAARIRDPGEPCLRVLVVTCTPSLCESSTEDGGSGCQRTATRREIAATRTRGPQCAHERLFRARASRARAGGAGGGTATPARRTAPWMPKQNSTTARPTRTWDSARIRLCARVGGAVSPISTLPVSTSDMRRRVRSMGSEPMSEAVGLPLETGSRPLSSVQEHRRNRKQSFAQIQAAQQVTKVATAAGCHLYACAYGSERSASRFLLRGGASG